MQDISMAEPTFSRGITRNMIKKIKNAQLPEFP